MTRTKLTFLLTLLMSMVVIKATAHDIAVANSDGVTIYYVWTNNQTELAVSYRGSYSYTYEDEYSGNVVIPNSITYNGITYSVTSVIGEAFEYCSTLTSVTLPNSLTSIGGLAFYGCSSLTSVTIPSTVTNIGIKPFDYCSSSLSIKVVVFDKFIFCNNRVMGLLDECWCRPVTLIDDNNNEIKDYIIPEGVINIGEYAFAHSDITSITIPSTVINISGGACYQCSNLTNVRIPVSDYSAFCNNTIVNLVRQFINKPIVLLDEYNNEIKEILIPNDVESIGSYAFYGCSGLTSIIIPKSISYIGSEAFAKCYYLSSINIPESVETIEVGAFDGCKFTSVTVNWMNPVSIGWSTFSYMHNATLYVPYGCYDAYANANYWKEFKEIIEMPAPNTITDISQVDNVIYIEPTEARCGSQATLSVKMKNNVAIQTIQFDLYLPDGITIVPNEDDELVTASKERINRFNYFDSSMQSDGALRLLAQATSTNVPAGDGEICRIVVDIPESMEEGDYPLILKGILMVEMDNTSHSPDPNLVQTKLTVLNYVPGDANNDGDVNAIDFNMIGNYILGRTQNGFNLKAADISGDDEVNAIDFNMVGNMILNGSTASARKRRAEATIDPE